MNILICQLFLLIFAESLFIHRCKGYVLLSENKSANQSSNWNNDSPASKAVDGNLAQSWPNVAATLESTSVDWYVDLGATRNIFNVVIYYRREGPSFDDFYRKRFAGFSLYISDDTNAKSGYKCPVNSTFPPFIYNISCQHSGRYVRLYNSRNNKSAILELAEVQVFGCESSIVYGVSCDQDCSTTCQDTRCDSLSGFCLSCAPGYSHLDKTCGCVNSTTYGVNCQQRCSSTCKDNQCDSFSGHCLSCVSGYRRKNKTCVACGKCTNGQSCNVNTGKCDNGCINGLYLPFCTEGILSRDKNCNMSAPYSSILTAEKAVDGIISQNMSNMALTEGSVYVFWHVDLGFAGNVKSVMIYYRSDGIQNSKTFRDRFAGFSLHISDDNNIRTGFECDVVSYPELQYNVSCQYAGCYVKLYNSRSTEDVFLELGEVQVYGCLSSTMYGENCEYTCPTGCKSNHCNAVDGHCFSCQAGYKGEKCEIECPAQTYGEGCKFQCSGNCKNYLTCDRFDGNCKNGCLTNYFGLNCSKPCPRECKNGNCNQTSGLCEDGCNPGHYNRPYCDKNCSHNCFDNEPCEENDGMCITGCASGYYGLKCDQRCSKFCLNEICNQSTGQCANCKSGFFGFPYCDKQCSINCINNDSCNEKNGECENGCKHGYFGTDCTKVCSGHCKNDTNCNQMTGKCDHGCAFNYYSPTCNITCSGNCKDNITCNSSSGFCENGCVSGYKGDECKDSCEDYEHGPNCALQCGKCKDKMPCNMFTGECKEGCDQGYQTPFCNSTCSDGFYGFDCSMNCSGNCNNGTICNTTSGYCDDGCDIGYEGDKCNKICDKGYYGIQCEEVCSENCEKGQLCNHKSGVCDFGCMEGFYGPQCRLNCSGNCLDDASCNKTTGVCDNGCAAGWQSSRCNQMCSNMTYGQNCESDCGFCKGGISCSIFSGECEHGCSPGYRTKLCNKECPPGKFGQNCTRQCSGNCVNNPCDKQDGSCGLQGCIAGWKGDLCYTKCSFGFFGDECSSACSGNCVNNDTCHHTNGSCLLGCAPYWDGEDCNRKVEPLTEPESPPTVGIAAGLVAVILIAVVVVGGVIYMRRRRRKQPDTPFSDIDNGGLTTPFTEQPNTLTQNEGTLGNLYANSAQVNGVDRGSPNDETYYNMSDNLIKADENVKTDELFNVIQNMSKSGNALFSKEYKELPQGEQHPCNFAKKQENMPKNRFKTTFPYDHSRVVLQLTTQCNSDYINADYIENANGERAYIAAQGPKPNTLTDFWRMVWQERVVKIVMLTNLVEGIKKKCDKYWPDTGEVMRKGDYVIQLQEEKMYSSYIIRTLLVTNKTTRQDREVVHFHYTQWPDHGVPDSLSLVMFHRHVIRTTTIETGKYTVVHCSAGIGRTGTYIALDALYRCGEKTGSVNVPNYVRTMRKDRMSMIQNEDQYVTVYNALYEAFRGKSRVIPKEEFVNEVEKQTNPSTPVNITYLRTSFNELNLLTPSYTKDDFFSGQENIDANFTKTVLPVERFRCNLYSYAKGRGSYYNAVYLQSFTMKDGLVSAQFPLPDYAEDFFRLVEDVEADIVVFVNPLSQIESTNQWMPVKETTRNVGTIAVTLDSPPLCTNNVKRTSLVLQKGESEGHKIDVFEPVSWSVKESLPSDPRVVLDLANQVQEVQSSKTNKRIIVLSADGAGGCGIFCSVFNGLQQLKLDSEVDMFSIIRQLKIRRPEMISNMDEYQFCFKVLAAHLKDDDIYANC